MGGKLSKNGGGGGGYYYSCGKEMMNLKHRVKVLQEEIKKVMAEREREYMNCEREIMMFAMKESEWRREKAKLRQEVAQLRKTVEEREEKIREMMKRDKMGIMEKGEDNSRKEWELMGTKLLVEKMKEERARRDEAVEKWKQLYLEIKTELDDLIQRTYNGDGLCWKAEENEVHIEKMKTELEDKEGTIKSLKSQLDSLEQEKIKKEREFDLLRQSLRIMNGNKSLLQTKEKLLKSKIVR
ncbi:uncharacterized protein LOC114753101 [Neltuma alba]|uniref:uncharacterized protein LOC114753101 n=1 Tax=Neltuma alba TaxID=207710 RepID=UPI0010A54347|nr:uncharacterized protein LOC114753101 [Prosopis alba]XP_028797601.1 uncharacterized protein LOC114753101 [Prosopis alba]